MLKHIVITAGIVVLAWHVWSSATHAQPPCFSPLVAEEGFDGGAFNLISGFDPSTDNRDGGAGDFFGVGNIASWPQGLPTPGLPFSLADDSVISVSSNGAGAPFPADTEGVFGQWRDVNDAFFAISDTREFEPTGLPMATWLFDISSVVCSLELHIDFGAQANDASGGFPKDAMITFDYQIDGGPTHRAFSIAPNPVFGGFAYRAMDSGAIPTVGANGPLEVTGDNPVFKLLADSGDFAKDTFLNKSPADAPAGPLDTFITEIEGQGEQLQLTMTANLDFEAMAFDNIQIWRVPEPAGLAAAGLAWAALLLLLPRRLNG